MYNIPKYFSDFDSALKAKSMIRSNFPEYYDVEIEITNNASTSLYATVLVMFKSDEYTHSESDLNDLTNIFLGAYMAYKG